MFGYIIVNKQELKFREFDVYQSYYCGLCQSLKERFGRRGQLTLSYDMTKTEIIGDFINGVVCRCKFRLGYFNRLVMNEMQGG